MKITQDTLFQGKLALNQPEKGYRYGIDAVLLAAACPAQGNQRILDLGCGVGTVMLSIAKRVAETHVIGIEIQAPLLPITQKNIEQNGFSERASIIQGHINDKSLFKKLGLFDHIVCNPPYFDHNKTNHSDIEQKNLSKIDFSGDLSEWIEATNRFLKPRGTATFIYPTSFSDKLISLLQQKFKTITVFPLWPRAQENCKRVLIQITKDRNKGFILKPGMIMHESNGDYTKAMLDIINNQKNLCLNA